MRLLTKRIPNKSSTKSPTPPNDFCAPLEAACTIGDLKTVETLVEQWLSNPQMSPNIVTHPMYEFNMAFFRAIEHNHPSIVSYLMSRGIGISNGATVWALKSRSIPIFEILVDHGLDINAPGPRLWSDLSPPPITYILDSEPLLRWFLAHGASPSAVTARGIVPLNIAAANHSLSIVRFLIENGADVKASNALQATAGGDGPDRLKILNYLLYCGADVNSFEYAYHKAGLEYYTALEAPPSRDPDEKIVGAATALHRATEMHRKDLVQTLLQKGADPALRMQGLRLENEGTKVVSSRIVKGMTAREIAESKGYDGLAVMLKDWEEARAKDEKQ